MTDKHRLKSVKKLPARDCKTRDGDNNKKERNDPLPACNYYDKTLESVLAIMVVSAISATTIASDVLHHHVFDSSTQSWQQRPAKKKPFVRVHVKVDKEAAQTLGGRKMNVRTLEITDRALADTGASVSMAGVKFMRSISVSEADLIRCAMRLFGADNSDIMLLGVIPVIMTDTVTGRTTRQLVYNVHCTSATRPPASYSASSTWAMSPRTSPPLSTSSLPAALPPGPARSLSVTVSAPSGRWPPTPLQPCPVSQPLTMSPSWSSGSETCMPPQHSTPVSVSPCLPYTGHLSRSTSKKGSSPLPATAPYPSLSTGIRRSRLG